MTWKKGGVNRLGQVASMISTNQNHLITAKKKPQSRWRIIYIFRTNSCQRLEYIISVIKKKEFTSTCTKGATQIIRNAKIRVFGR